MLWADYKSSQPARILTFLISFFIIKISLAVFPWAVATIILWIYFAHSHPLLCRMVLVDSIPSWFTEHIFVHISAAFLCWQWKKSKHKQMLAKGGKCRAVFSEKLEGRKSQSRNWKICHIKNVRERNCKSVFLPRPKQFSDACLFVCLFVCPSILTLLFRLKML